MGDGCRRNLTTSFKTCYLFRLNATVDIHQEMKYTERMAFLYLKWMEKTTRLVTKLYLKSWILHYTCLITWFGTQAFVFTLFFLVRFTAKTCVYWPSCFLTTRLCTMMWNLSCFMLWRQQTPQGVTWLATFQRWDITSMLFPVKYLALEILYYPTIHCPTKLRLSILWQVQLLCDTPDSLFDENKYLGPSWPCFLQEQL